ncbi:hypothetical protein ACP4OV_023545 [Aristida adscensionis]
MLGVSGIGVLEVARAIEVEDDAGCWFQWECEKRLGSKVGLFAIENQLNDVPCVSLRDPFSSRAVRLPLDPDGLLASSKTTRCFLSTPRPTDPGCVVLVAHRTAPVLCYCRPSDTRWLRHEYRPELLNDGGRYSRGGIIPGTFYTQWFDMLVTLRFSPEPTFSTSQVMDEPSETSSYLLTRSYLLESCGELFTVRFCYTKLCAHRVLRVEVQKLDWSRSTWVKVTGLGDRAFFCH